MATMYLVNLFHSFTYKNIKTQSYEKQNEFQQFIGNNRSIFR